MKIKFLGATHQMTGSSYLLEDTKIKILVDCGMFQERNFINRNWDPFPVPAEKIQYVLLTHIHQDHSGSHTQTCQRRIYRTNPHRPEASKRAVPHSEFGFCQKSKQKMLISKKDATKKKAEKAHTPKFHYTQSRT